MNVISPLSSCVQSPVCPLLTVTTTTVTAIALIALGSCATAGLISQAGIYYGIPMLALGTFIGTLTSGVWTYCKLSKKELFERQVYPQRITLKRKIPFNTLFIPKNVENQKLAFHVKALITRLELSEYQSIIFKREFQTERFGQAIYTRTNFKVITDGKEFPLNDKDKQILRYCFAHSIPREGVEIIINSEEIKSKLPDFFLESKKLFPAEHWAKLLSHMDVSSRLKFGSLNHAFYALSHDKTTNGRCHISNNTPEKLHLLLCETGNNIKELDLTSVTRGCGWALNDRIGLMNLLPIYCPNLTRLNLSDNAFYFNFDEIISQLPSLTHLTLQNCSIQGEVFAKLVKVLPQLTSLQLLDLSHNIDFGTSGARKLADILPKLKSLIYLNISSCKICSTGMEILAPKLPSKLRYLNLSNNGLGLFGTTALCETLSNLTSLEHLNLEGNSISNGLEPLVKVLPYVSETLISLNLANNTLEWHMKHLVPLLDSTSFPYLRNLNLSRNSIKDNERLQLINTISKLPFLNYLNISNTHEGEINSSKHELKIILSSPSEVGPCASHDSSICIKDHISKFEPEELRLLLYEIGDNIKELDLTGVTRKWTINDKIALMRSLPLCCPNLSKLNLSDNTLCDSFVQALSKLSSLTHLTLQNCNIDGKSFASFADILSKLTSLELLDLSYNIKFGKSGAKALAGILSKLSSLRCLNLEHCLIGSEGMKALAPKLPNELKSLNLSNNLLGPKGTIAFSNALCKMTSLEHLNLQRNSISYALESLAKALPNVNKTLISLNLAKNPHSMRPLINCLVLNAFPCLRDLNLSGNSIEKDESNQLINAVSKCPFIRYLNISNAYGEEVNSSNRVLKLILS